MINIPPILLTSCTHTVINSRLIAFRATFRPCTSIHYASYRFISVVKEDTHPLKDDIENKIIFNSFLHQLGFLDKKRLEKLENKLKDSNLKVVPVSLKYLTNDEQIKKTIPVSNIEEANYLVNLPYSLKTVGSSILLTEDVQKPLPTNVSQEANIETGELISDFPAEAAGKWMNDYEMYTEESADACPEEVEIWRRNYGTEDRSVPVSRVPCGGCGALLHCQDHSIPGYLPSEIFKNCSSDDLRETICQRCHFMKNYNTALSVTVDPQIYPKLLSKIKDAKALVILMADMTDLPWSLWPGILDIIGAKRPIFLVGNKVDLLWGDRRGWLEQAAASLRSCLPPQAAVRYVSLISAKTGFGVEELVSKLQNLWQYKGDVYLIGCTNVGKSTLFNALLQSDYCKVKAIDLVQRATTAPWPGTTINLLKFPILRPEGWRLYLRTMRLKEEQKKRGAEQKLLKQQRKAGGKKVAPQLVGHIGRTFFPKPQKDEVEAIDNFTMGSEERRFGLNPKDPDFAASKWLYDTPGVLHQQQILEFLTTEEISLTMPKDVIEPRTFSLKEGRTLFVAGLARIDFINGKNNIKLTVFSSNSLPITITNSKHADEVYNELLGTQYLLVPSGPKERLRLWPGLQSALEVSLVGIDSEESCADITLSSTGWISVTPKENEIVNLQIWTPEGRGVQVRSPSLLSKAVALRGKKNGRTPAYHRTRPFI